MRQKGGTSRLECVVLSHLRLFENCSVRKSLLLCLMQMEDRKFAKSPKNQVERNENARMLVERACEARRLRRLVEIVNIEG